MSTNHLSNSGLSLASLPKDCLTHIFTIAGAPHQIRQIKDPHLKTAQDAAIRLQWKQIEPKLRENATIAGYMGRYGSVVNVDSFKSPQKKFEFLFRKMTRHLGGCPPSIRGLSRVSLDCYEMLAKEIEDLSLERAWDAIRFQLNGAVYLPAVDARAGAIRLWLEDPVNAPLLEGIISLDLSNGQLLTIPSVIRLFTNLRSLRLGENQIRNTNSGSFQGLAKLRSLDLSGNQLRTLGSAVFKRLPNLRDLDLSRNEIAALDLKPFEGLRNLGYLNLSRNEIVEIGLRSFEGLGNLRHLRLSDNEIVEIDSRAFAQLGLANVFLDGDYISERVLQEISSNVARLHLLNRINSFKPTLWQYVENLRSYLPF